MTESRQGVQNTWRGFVCVHLLYSMLRIFLIFYVDTYCTGVSQDSMLLYILYMFDSAGSILLD